MCGGGPALNERVPFADTLKEFLMMRLSIFALLSLTTAILSAEPTLDSAFQRIYSFDFAGGAERAKLYAQANATDPLGPAAVAASHLFGEMHRLNLFSDGKSGAKANPAVKKAMEAAIAETDARAKARLARDPKDRDALVALMMVRGLERDYLALVEKSYRASWVSAREAQAHALELTRTHPEAKDAWYTIGFSDYLIATVPFVVRPFMKMEMADGNRARGIANLEKAATGGQYLKGFAQLMLANIYKKEKRAADAERTLRDLAREYPDNPVIRREISSNSL